MALIYNVFQTDGILKIMYMNIMTTHDRKAWWFTCNGDACMLHINYILCEHIGDTSGMFTMG